MRAFDGTVSIVQPLILPLYRGRSAHEVVGVFTKRPERTPYDRLRDYWTAQPQAAGQIFDKFWRRSVHDGLIAGHRPACEDGEGERRNPAADGAAPSGTGGLEIHFAPDPAVYDGRFANNGWLQELPKPLTKLTWDNVAMIGPSTAVRLGLKNEDVVEIQVPEPHGERTRLGAAGSCPGRRHRAPRVRPHACRTRRRGRRVQRLHAAHIRRAVVRLRRTAAQDRRLVPPRRDAGPSLDGRPRHRPGRHHRRLQGRPRIFRSTSRRRRRNRSRCTRTGSTRATSGAWRSTRRSAPAARPAWSRAWRRTTSPSSARSRCCAAVRCTGSASIATSRGRPTTRRSTTSRCSASTARTRRARWSARWRRRRTARRV